MEVPFDSDSYVALAGYVRDSIHRKIKRALEKKFHGDASPVLVPEDARRPQDIVVYSYLFKNLQFPTKYERGEFPLPYGKQKVECFGMGPQYKPGRDAMASQTLIHNYVSKDDFVIELRTKSVRDHLVLAKIAPRKTLAQTVAAVRRRLVVSPDVAYPVDILIVPKSNFDIIRSYDELLSVQLVPTSPGMADDLRLLDPTQNIRFQMDEIGVRLKSETSMQFGCSAPPPSPQPIHLLIFDKPFLIMMSRADDEGDGKAKPGVPYFALWVANPELLVHGEMIRW